MKTTTHQIITGEAQYMSKIKDKSIHLVVTSPPYPMIKMWDNQMIKQNPEIEQYLFSNPLQAFNLMHKELDKVWREVERVLIPGGYVCINIGDALRTIKGKFKVYPNHAKIIHSFIQLGFTYLPSIIWFKRTNPSRFFGSGTLPLGAYVKYEHEWILIFRKEGIRNTKDNQYQQKRRESSFFFEERNTWFSNIWNICGIPQTLNYPQSRERSGAFPIEIPFRLINMYSIQGDTVLDPFIGTGTTTMAAILNQRNSIGYEIDPIIKSLAITKISSLSVDHLNTKLQERLKKHENFITNYSKTHTCKFHNVYINTPVITQPEAYLKPIRITDISLPSPDLINVGYK